MAGWRTDTMKQEFRTEILPLFKSVFPGVALPTELEVWDGDELDGGAFGTTVFVYEGVAKVTRCIRLWAMAHETGHVVTVASASRCGVGNEIPDGPGHYHKAEYLADLIATHVIAERAQSMLESLKPSLPQLASLLGSGDAMHPNGTNRVALMNEYLQARRVFLSSSASIRFGGSVSTGVFQRLFTRVFRSTTAPYLR